MSYREDGTLQNLKLPNNYSKLRVKHSKFPTKMTPITMRIILYTMLCLGKITLPLLEDGS